MIWILANWRLLLTGAAIALLGLLLVLERAESRSWEKKHDQMQALYQNEQIAHAVTRQSVATLQAQIEDQNTAVNALAVASETRTRAAEDGRKAAQEAARASESKAQALDASAAVARPGVPCVPSDVFWSTARKDL